jgi:putative PEP-CTERM system histidine kinase
MTSADAAVYLLQAVTIAVYIVLALLLVRSKRGGTVCMLFSAGCGATAVWAAAGLAGLQSGTGAAGSAIDLARSVVWCALPIHLLRRQSSTRRGSIALIGCLVAVCCGAVIGVIQSVPPGSPSSAQLISYLALAVYGAFLADNLYRLTPPDARWHVNLLCIGLGGVFVYDIVFYADALLFGRFSGVFAEGRPLVALIAAPLFVMSAVRNRDWVIDIHLSRDVVYHTGSLILAGCFLIALAIVGETFRRVGPHWGALAEIGLIAAGSIGIGIVLTSGSTRARLRHLLTYNFFSHRYDYRKEWLRCIETLSGGVEDKTPARRIIRSLAAVTDSPGGQLWLRDPGGAAFHWLGSWNLPAGAGPEPVDSAFVEKFRNGYWVIELSREPALPGCLADMRAPWLAVPLSHLGRLLGFAVLTAPRAPFRLDSEVFDLLRILGRQAAGHAAEWQHFKAILEARDLHDFSKRFAFAVHDMKNVAGQLTMIVQNAKRSGDDPEFHQDVLATVEAALGRLNGIMEQLRAPPQRAGAVSVPLDIVEQEIAAIRRSRGVQIGFRHDGRRAGIATDAGVLRSVLCHLCENAIEASDGQVEVTIRHDRSSVLIDIADTGAGMTPEFVRDRLFTPFGSTKVNGFGLGAYQARDLIRSIGGDVLVHSRPGVGTTMRITLPCMAEQDEPVASSA